jgi:hypothetical protein
MLTNHSSLPGCRAQWACTPSRGAKIGFVLAKTYRHYVYSLNRNPGDERPTLRERITFISVQAGLPLKFSHVAAGAAV